MTNTTEQTVATEVSTVAPAASTKDAGRVHVGGGMMRFDAPRATTKDAGRVHVGGGMMRF